MHFQLCLMLHTHLTNMTQHASADRTMNTYNTMIFLTHAWVMCDSWCVLRMCVWSVCVWSMEWFYAGTCFTTTTAAHVFCFSFRLCCLRHSNHMLFSAFITGTVCMHNMKICFVMFCDWNGTLPIIWTHLNRTPVIGILCIYIETFLFLHIRRNHIPTQLNSKIHISNTDATATRSAIWMPKNNHLMSLTLIHSAGMYHPLKLFAVVFWMSSDFV